MDNDTNMMNGFGAQAKTNLVIAGVIIAVLLAFSAYWIFSKEYQSLFVGLEPKDSAAVVKQLDEMKVNYKINKDNGNVEVPAGELHNIRLKLMGSDVALNGGVGYEIFDNSDFGMTEFAQRINFQRALEGELQRTIMSLKQVKQARVHLVLPERSLFRDNKEAPTASVTLIMKKGMVLDNAQITGIQRLVSASVSGLKEHMVIIGDQDGMTLTQAMPMDEAVQVIPWRLQQKMDVEQYLIEKVNRVLVHAFGQDKVMVSVDVVMNFNQVTKKEEKVIPLGEGSAISRQKETTFGKSGKSKNGTNNTTREIEYEMGHSIAEIVESPGELKKINVGILLPSSLTEKDAEQIQRLVEVTVGIDKVRGDSVALYFGNNRRVTSSMAASQVVAPRASASELSNSLPANVVPNVLPSSPVDIETKNVEGFLEYIQSNKLMFIVFSAILLLLCLVVWFFSRSKKVDKEVLLSTDEREKLLMQLQHWLSEAK